MNLTVAYLREHFHTFNRAYFGGELPEPRLAVSNSRTRLGVFSCRRKRKGLFGYENVGYTIRISEYYDLPEEEYQNTLLHEMIHYYLAFRHVRDTSAHGAKFREIMNSLNARGWHITVSANVRQWPVAQRNVRTSFLVLAMTVTGGKRLLSVVNPDYRSYIDRLATRTSAVIRHQWLRSNDPYFMDFPVTRSLRGRKVSQEVFDKVVAESDRVE